MAPFDQIITSEDDWNILGTPARSLLKERPEVDAHARAFISALAIPADVHGRTRWPVRCLIG